MRIDPKDTVAGQPVMKVRELLKKGANRAWGTSFVQQILGINSADAVRAISELERLGYVERSAQPDEGGYWRNTLKGNSLALATAARPLSRSSADRKFDEFMGRVAEVRDNPYFLFKVKQVVIFGSYLGAEEQVNDIDIAVELVPKEKDFQKREQLFHERIEEVCRQGKEFRSSFEQVSWPQVEVWRYLKSRARSISLHQTDDPILSQSVSKVVYYDEE